MLLPVLDDDKHYWVGDDEVDKLLRRGGDWLGSHPERADHRRYLRHDRHLTGTALARLLEVDDSIDDPDAAQVTRDARGRPGTARTAQRAAPPRWSRRSVPAGSRRIADLGCGEGTLLRALLAQPWVSASSASTSRGRR